MIRWEEVLADTGLFHCSGITCAISRDAMNTTFDAVKLADSLGLTISCDINYRKTSGASVWKPTMCSSNSCSTATSSSATRTSGK